MTPEGKVKRKVSRLLKETEYVYYHMPVQNGMGRPTLDYVGCHMGRFFAIETKAPGKKPTARQKLTMQEMESAGAEVFLIDSVDAIGELDQWLKEN